MPDCDGIVLGGHGLFTWGDTQRECYVNTITIIDQIGQFVLGHGERTGSSAFGGQRHAKREDREELANRLFPIIRGMVSSQKRLIGSYTGSPEVLHFVNSNWAAELAHLGTSCPDHFIRTKICPLFVDWNPAKDAPEFRAAFESAIKIYREEYRLYYGKHATADSPAIRDPNPTVVLVPGVGMFSFGKSKTEARITGEFYVNAIHVMEGATALDGENAPASLPQAGAAAPHSAFTMKHNYVALPPLEAFRIEYWALEEAKLRRQPPEKGVQPSSIRHRWRRERDRARNRDASGAARRACCGRRPQFRSRAAALQRKLQVFAVKKMCSRWRSIFATANPFAADCKWWSLRSAASIV